MQNDNEDQSILLEWKRILPTCVEISCGNFTDCSHNISDMERESIGEVDPMRFQEFSAGRTHAHLALDAINIKTTSIPKCQRSGKAIWPIGVIGSITHTSSKKREHVAAAVGYLSDINHLGIDAEIDLNLHPNLWPLFLTKEELIDLAKAPVAQRSKRVNILWCLKESAIKASGVNNMLQINSKATDFENGVYSISVSSPEVQLLMLGRGVLKNGVTLAATYSI